MTLCRLTTGKHVNCKQVSREWTLGVRHTKYI